MGDNETEDIIGPIFTNKCNGKVIFLLMEKKFFILAITWKDWFENPNRFYATSRNNYSVENQKGTSSNFPW